MPVIDPFSVDADWSSQRSPVRESTGYHSLNGVLLENAPDWSGFVFGDKTLTGQVDPDSRDAFFAALEAGRASSFPASYTVCVTASDPGVSTDGQYVYKSEFHQPFGHYQEASVAARHVVVFDDISWSYSGSDPAMVGSVTRQQIAGTPQLGYVLWPDDTAVELTCTRLYFSAADATGTPYNAPNVPIAATWEHSYSGGKVMLFASPATSTDGTTDPSNGDEDQFHRAGYYKLTGAGRLSGTVKAQFRCRQRTGVGVGTQDHQAQMVIRIAAPDGTIRGTLLDAHETATVDSGTFQTSLRNIHFPAGALWGDQGVPMTPVSYQNGDWVLVEIGSRYIDGGPGIGTHIYWNDQAGAAGDLPEDETTTTNLRSWIDFCTPGGLP